MQPVRKEEKEVSRYIFTDSSSITMFTDGVELYYYYLGYYSNKMIICKIAEIDEYLEKYKPGSCWDYKLVKDYKTSLDMKDIPELLN